MLTMDFEEPAWVEDGMIVWIWWNRERNSLLRCEVACAAGNHARVVNASRSVDKWFAIGDLQVPKGDSHGYDALPDLTVIP
jgi:hypothetical protein